jgi:hypothetical protein
MYLVRAVVAAGCLSLAGCAHAGIAPATRPPAAADALVVLTGFGYGRGGERAFRALDRELASEGIDLYVPAYVARAGLEPSRDRLRRFIRDARLDRYERVHVFAFIAGGWTFNPLADTGALPNLATVIYDRSPYQERAPRVAMEKLPFPARLKYGDILAELARTPYAPLTIEGPRVGILVETRPTSFVRRFARTAQRYGPYQFECDSFAQRYDDCAYVAMTHDDLYERFAEVWPEVRAFIRDGRFTGGAIRTPPVRREAAAAQR